MKNDTIQKLAHDMRGFISCWREWKMPGSPFRLTDSDWFADFTKRAEALAGKPLRNCDRFDGDYKMLHTAWFDWTGSPSGQNADGTVKMTFAEWLLAPAQKGGAK